MSDPSDEFVTIAEAARRLGISERQVRRDAGRLPDNDRRDAGHGPDNAGHRGATLVRLDALAALRGQAVMPDGAGHHAGHTPDTFAPDAGHVPDTGTSRPDTRDELIEQLRGEVDRLNAALERTQTHLGQALGALASEQQRTHALEIEAGKLIAALPAPAPPQGSRQDPETGPVGNHAGNGSEAAQTAKPRVSWLVRLLGRGT